MLGFAASTHCLTITCSAPSTLLPAPAQQTRADTMCGCAPTFSHCCLSLSYCAPDLYNILIAQDSIHDFDGMQLVKEVQSKCDRGRIVITSFDLSPARKAAYENLTIYRILQKPDRRMPTSPPCGSQKH